MAPWCICQYSTLSQTNPGFYMSALKSLLKTLWEKEKSLVMSNFSFTHSVFYTFGELSTIFTKFQNCRLQSLSIFQFGRVQNLSFGKVLSQYESLQVDILYQGAISLQVAVVWGGNWSYSVIALVDWLRRFVSINQHSSQLGRFRTYIKPRLY